MSVSFIIAIRGEGSTQTGAFDCKLCAHRMQIMKKMKKINKKNAGLDRLHGNWDADGQVDAQSLSLSVCYFLKHTYIH